MLKKVKCIVSAIVITAVLFTSVISVSASSATLEDYTSVNTLQKEYYTGTYVPCYYAYLQALRDFRTQIHNTHFTNIEQAQRVLNFLKELRARDVDFFGTRETVGKSRYEVPAARVAMYKAADEDCNYDLAIQYCNTLKALVEARVNFLNGIMNEINSFELIPSSQSTTTTTITTTTAIPTTTTTTEATTVPTTTTTTPAMNAIVEFNANQIWSTYSFGFKIVVSNNTNQDISDWTLDFNITGATINTVWVNGGSMKLKIKNETVSITPQNKWQNGYTIPANGSIVIEGNANGNAYDVMLSNAYLDDTSVTINYII